MTLPTALQIFAVLEATWPPASRQTVGHWTIRAGADGGKRVSATTGSQTSEISTAEAAMAALNQPSLFMIRPGDSALDHALAKRGYDIIDPVVLFACPIETLTTEAVPALAAFTIWPPLAIMAEIWGAGGIDGARLNVMRRANSPKTAIFARAEDRPAGAAFVAIHAGIAMIHAIEVAPDLRRNRAAINIMRASAHWAQNQGARYFSLAVTDANLAAIGLYTKLGLSVVGHYHYRMKQKQ